MAVNEQDSDGVSSKKPGVVDLFEMQKVHCGEKCQEIVGDIGGEWREFRFDCVTRSNSAETAAYDAYDACFAVIRLR